MNKYANESCIIRLQNTKDSEASPKEKDHVQKKKEKITKL